MRSSLAVSYYSVTVQNSRIWGKKCTRATGKFVSKKGKKSLLAPNTGNQDTIRGSDQLWNLPLNMKQSDNLIQQSPTGSNTWLGPFCLLLWKIFLWCGWITWSLALTPNKKPHYFSCSLPNCLTPFDCLKSVISLSRVRSVDFVLMTKWNLQSKLVCVLLLGY